MPAKPILLFLHGVGSGDQDGRWKKALNGSLSALGYPDLSEVKVIAPPYPNTLHGADDNEPLPELTIKSLRGKPATENRREFERRTGAIEVMLGRHDQGSGWFAGDKIVDVAVHNEKFVQANHYITNSQIRAQVLNRVLRDLPERGRIVIVGHSLGSVIAADLLRRLPVGLEVAGMVTIGSPLANSNFHVGKLRATLKDPPQNLAWWVNFWKKSDPVTTGEGISSVFPWMLDYRVRQSLGRDMHAAARYLAHEEAAEVIGFALFGSRSLELATVTKAPEIALDDWETGVILRLRYAHLIRTRLEDDRQERYSDALRQVQSRVIDALKQRRANDNRQVPAAVARLAVDLSDPGSAAPSGPPIAVAWSKDDAVVPLLHIAMLENVIAPFEIKISQETRQESMEDLTLELGLGSQIGTDVFRAAECAEDALDGGVNWLKWGAVGLGTAAVVAGTGGLALAAAPGVVGAAAVTSALAAFGPGGMIGGLVTAGALVGAGSGGIAIGMAGPTASAAAVEANVASHLAVAILREKQRLEQDPEVWNFLVELAAQLRRECACLEVCSDESAPSLQELRKKITAVDRAVAYLREQGLAPVRQLGMGEVAALLDKP